MNPDNYQKLIIAPLIGKTADRMASRLTSKFRQAGYNISIAHWIVLSHLWQEDGRNQQELGGMTDRHKTAITRAVNWLEERSFVVRVPDNQDRRNKLIYLTHKGKKLKEELFPFAIETIEEAVAGIPKEKLEACKSVLHKIFKNLEEEIEY